MCHLCCSDDTAAQLRRHQNAVGAPNDVNWWRFHIHPTIYLWSSQLQHTSRSRAISGAVPRSPLRYDLWCVKCRAGEHGAAGPGLSSPDSSLSTWSIGIFFFFSSLFSWRVSWLDFQQQAECILSPFKTLPPGSSMATLDNETQGR